jgi:hypothetical protein
LRRFQISYPKDNNIPTYTRTCELLSLLPSSLVCIALLRHQTACNPRSGAAKPAKTAPQPRRLDVQYQAPAATLHLPGSKAQVFDAQHWHPSMTSESSPDCPTEQHVPRLSRPSSPRRPPQVRHCRNSQRPSPAPPSLVSHPDQPTSSDATQHPARPAPETSSHPTIIPMLNQHSSINPRVATAAPRSPGC